MRNLGKLLVLTVLFLFVSMGMVFAGGKADAGLSVEPGYFESQGTPALAAVNKLDEQLNPSDDELVIYYYRPDGNYEPWALWIWAIDGGAGEAAWDYSQDWQVADGIGYMRFKKDGSNAGGAKLTDSKGMTGLIPRQDGSWTKDGDADRIWDTNISNRVIIVSGDMELHYPGPFAVKIRSAELVKENTIELELNAKYGLDLDPLTGSGFVVQESDGSKTYDIAKVYNTLYPKKPVNNYADNVTIELVENVPASASLVVVKEGFQAPATVSTTKFSVEFAERAVPAKDEVLGAVFNPEDKSVTFKLWAPTSSSVDVLIYKTGNATTATYEEPMTLDSKTGVWSVVFNKENVDGWFYEYRIKNAKGTSYALDPYAKSMAAFSEQNGGNGRAAIVDLTSEKANPASGWEGYTGVELKKYEDAIIYEVSVRDFTISPDAKVKAPAGTYTAFIEKLPYLKELGVTHIQILPVLNFYYGNENDKSYESDGTSSGNNYNWGYDPHNYFTPEGWYSLNPSDPYARIAELKTLVKEAHKLGLGVILDVVYNHMAKTDFMEQIVPGYFFRMNENGGFLSNSGCGNDVATERTMARKLIVDSTKYWVDEYKVDGFRFDLMGLIDSETMLDAYAACAEVKPQVLFVGEGWKMYNGPAGTVGMDQNYMNKTNSIAVFNDELRDAVKAGGYNEAGQGFITNKAPASTNYFFELMMGRPVNNYRPDDPGDSIQYLVCHDGLTLHDSIVNNAKINESTPEGKAEVIRRIKMGNFIGLTSQGIAFLHAGQERGRTKPKLNATSETVGNFVRNSYDSSDNINQIVWTLDDDYNNLLDYTKGMIAIRKANEIFRLGTAEEVKKAASLIPGSEGFMIGYKLADKDGTWVVLMNGDKSEAKSLDTGIDLTNAVVYADENSASVEGIANPSGVKLEGTTATLEPLTAILLKVAK